MVEIRWANFLVLILFEATSQKESFKGHSFAKLSLHEREAYEVVYGFLINDASLLGICKRTCAPPTLMGYARKRRTASYAGGFLFCTLAGFSEKFSKNQGKRLLLFEN